jgi:hypothetical protein
VVHAGQVPIAEELGVGQHKQATVTMVILLRYTPDLDTRTLLRAALADAEVHSCPNKSRNLTGGVSYSLASAI